MISDTIMVSESVLEALQPMEFTRGLEPRHLVKLASMATEVTFEEGETIFHENDIGSMIYIIRAGRVARYIRVPGRGKVTILTVEPGRLLGWSSLFPPHHKTAGARAMLPTYTLAINAAQLREVCQADYELGYIIMCRVTEAITSRLISTRLQLIDMFAPISRD
jgi:CRP-like cAMP-binding protein